MKTMNHYRDVNNQFQKSLWKTKKPCLLKIVIFSWKRLVVGYFGGWNQGTWIIDQTLSEVRKLPLSRKWPKLCFSKPVDGKDQIFHQTKSKYVNRGPGIVFISFIISGNTWQSDRKNLFIDSWNFLSELQINFSL